MADAILTQERLKELLHYDPKTGVFTWIKNTKAHLIGNQVGSINDRGYVLINIAKKTYRAHRLAWLYQYGVWPCEVDHINRIKTDNRIANLRAVTRSDNLHNMPLLYNREGKLQGVSWSMHAKKWLARIKVNGKQKYLGYFNTKEAAHTEYLANKRKFHPNFNG